MDIFRTVLFPVFQFTFRFLHTNMSLSLWKCTNKTFGLADMLLDKSWSYEQIKCMYPSLEIMMLGNVWNFAIFISSRESISTYFLSLWFSFFLSVQHVVHLHLITSTQDYTSLTIEAC